MPTEEVRILSSGVAAHAFAVKIPAMFCLAGYVRPISPFLLLTGLLLALPLQIVAEENKPEQVAEMAFNEWKAGHSTNAIALISEAIRTDPKESRWWHLRAQMNSLLGKRDATIDDLGHALECEPRSRVLLQGRAEELFKAGRITESVRDFDKVNEVEPAFAPYNWQRGIALYFAGRFADGRKQFESHQTVNPHDVENAVWHFLCTARELDFSRAQARLIPIDGDDRVPMTEIHRLFGGQSTPEKVLAEVAIPADTIELTRQQRFYAHLYLALYFEVQGDAVRLASELKSCQPLATQDDFMSHVARVMAAKVKPEAWKPPLLLIPEKSESSKPPTAQ